MGILGIAVLFLSEFVPTKAKEQVSDDQDYAQQICTQLENTLSQIEGVGEVNVMVTLEESERNNYLSEDTINQADDGENSNYTSQQTYVYEQSATGGSKVAVTSVNSPTIAGILIVCQGGDRADVENRIITAVTTVLHISSARVCVAKMSS